MDTDSERVSHNKCLALPYLLFDRVQQASFHFFSVYLVKLVATFILQRNGRKHSYQFDRFSAFTNNEVVPCVFFQSVVHRFCYI